MHLPKALFIIVSSTLIITGGTHLFIRKKREKHMIIDYRITHISQQSHGLPTDYLAELMHLSIDKPPRLSRFNLEKARARLLASPLIIDATITPKKPHALAVDYILREPLLALADFDNLAIDLSSVPIPLTPYLTPKNLPELYLGLKTPPKWHEPLSHPSLELAHELYTLCLEYHLPVTRLDLTNARAKSLGQREIVLVIDGHTLRLSLKNLSQQLANYLQLRPDLLQCEPQIIDLRIKDLAFIKWGQA